jgi:hypothetical protein
VGGGDSRFLADALRADHDVVEVEVDVGKRGQQLGVEPRRALVTFPAGVGAGDRVDAVLGKVEIRPGRSRLSSAIECVFQSSRISATSSGSIGRRRRSRIRSLATACHFPSERRRRRQIAAANPKRCLRAGAGASRQPEPSGACTSREPLYQTDPCNPPATRPLDTRHHETARDDTLNFAEGASDSTRRHRTTPGGMRGGWHGVEQRFTLRSGSVPATAEGSVRTR